MLYVDEPAEVNYRPIAGATFKEIITVKENGAAFNLTGYSAKFQARRYPTDASPAIDLNTTNGKIVLGGAAGTIEITETPTNTRAWSQAGLLYQLEIEDGAGAVTCLVAGTITVLPEIAI